MLHIYKLYIYTKLCNFDIRDIIVSKEIHNKSYYCAYSPLG